MKAGQSLRPEIRCAIELLVNGVPWEQIKEWLDEYFPTKKFEDTIGETKGPMQ